MPPNYFQGIAGNTSNLAQLLGQPGGGGQNNPYGATQLPYFEEDRDELQGYLSQGSPYQGQAPIAQTSQVGQDPYRGDWSSLIAQLQAQARGEGPSLAEQQYRAAQQDTVSALTSQGRASGSAGAGRMAAQRIGQAGQGLAQGVAQARTAEQMGAYGMLTGALTGGSNSAFQREGLNAQLGQSANNLNAQLQAGANQSNQQAWLTMLGQQLGLSEAQLQALIAQLNAQAGVDQVNAGQPSAFDQLLGAATGIGVGLATGRPKTA